MKKIMIIAGGTGGHIFPGIAVAEALKQQLIQVSWLGSEIGMEKHQVPSYFSFYAVRAYQLRGKGLKAYLQLPWRLTYAIAQSLAILRKIKPDVVISFGGFVAGPGSLAAMLLRIPVVIHEQNARAGLTNRYLAKRAKKILQAFPNAFPLRVNALTVGNPIRASILSLPDPAERLATHQGPLRVLILGGSLGALSLNEAVVAWFCTFHRHKEILLKHQTGQAHYQRVRDAYEKAQLSVEVLPFIENMAETWAWTDVVICRSGAITVSEVAAVGVAAVFVPMPHAVDNHQFHNANYLAAQGAGLILEQSLLSAVSLTEIMCQFLENRTRVLDLSILARSLAKPRATCDIVSQVLALF